MRPSSVVLWSRASLVAMWCAGLVQLAILSQVLPEQVASHFDWAGRVDGWSSRGGFVVALALFETFLTAVFLGAGELILRVPRTWINLPGKGYWLAPERERKTRATLMRDLATIGLSTMALVFFLVHECYALSTGLQRDGHRLGTAVVIGLVVVLGWVGLLIRRYSRRPRS